MCDNCKHHGVYNIIGNFARLAGGGCRSCQDDPTESDKVIFSGPNLACSGGNTCDSLTVILQKMDAQICILQETINNLTLTTTTTINI